MTDISCLKLSKPKIFNRTVTLKRDEGYGISRTTLINSWKLPDDTQAYLRINGVKVAGPSNFFLAKDIREYLRDQDPIDSETNSLCITESTIFAGQLTCLEYYCYFPINQMFDYIFTGGLCITFDIVDGEPNKINIEESFVLSKTQIQEKLMGGETLESLETNNREGVEFNFNINTEN